MFEEQILGKTVAETPLTLLIEKLDKDHNAIIIQLKKIIGDQVEAKTFLRRFTKFQQVEVKGTNFIFWDKFQLYGSGSSFFSPPFYDTIKDKFKVVDEIEGWQEKNIDVPIPDLLKTGCFSIDYLDSGRTSYNRTSWFTIKITLPIKMFKFAGITKETKVALQIINDYWTSNKISNIYDLSFKASKPKLSGSVKLNDGSFFYIPKEGCDRRKEYLKRIQEKEALPKNTLILIDGSRNVLVQTNSVGQVQEINVACSKITIEDLNRLLQGNFSDTIIDNIPGSLSNIWSFPGLYMSGLEKATYEKRVAANDEERDLKEKNRERKLGEMQNDGILLPYLRRIKDYYTEKKDSVLPTTYLSAMGFLQAILQNAKKHKIINTQVLDKRKKFDIASKDTTPKIPSLKKGLLLFPHQAESIAKLEEAGETAILDIGTGGGKSPILIADILNLMGKGKVKRPLVVMPAGILGQWVGEVNFFTEGKINIIVLSTETVKNWGEKEIGKLVSSAPPNTIFLSSYSFLTNKAEEGEFGIYNFPQLNWIKNVLSPDYIAMDESHFAKNVDSLRSQACQQFKEAKYRRLSTGTLISNTPTDLPGQLAFLDPGIVGNPLQFAAKYATQYDRKTGKVYSWREDAREMIRKDLKENSFYLNYREKDWAATLPDIKRSMHIAKMSSTQKKVYKLLVTQILEEIMADPKLKVKWLEFMQGNEEGKELAYAPLIGKLARLEQFLTAPDHSKFVALKLPDDEKRSPKQDIIDELIGKSIKLGQKCIVAVHYKWSALHLLNNSRYKNVGLYYDASHKKNVKRFIENPKIKVLFAVQQSLTEGLNLQAANRIILGDMDWTAGKAKQLQARVYRPWVKISKAGKIINLNKSKTVHIDTVLCDESADVLKYCYQTWKRLFNAEILEKSPVKTPKMPSINEDNLFAGFGSMGGQTYLGQDEAYYNWLNTEIEEVRKAGKADPIMVKPAPDIKGSKINTPWVLGQPMILDKGEALDRWIEKENIDIEDIRPSYDKLVNRFIKSEYGEGRIVSVHKNSVTIKNSEGNKFNVNIFKAILLTDTKFDSEEALFETETEPVKIITADNIINLNLLLYNSIITLTANLNDPDHKRLKKLGFKYQGDYFYFHVKSRKMGNELLDILSKKYRISNVLLQRARDIIENIRKKKYEYEIPKDLKNFYKMKKIPASKGQLKLYTMVEDDGDVYLVYDKITHRKVNLTKYRFQIQEGYYCYFCKNKNEVKSMVKKIEAYFEIENKEELIEDGLRCGVKIRK